MDFREQGLAIRGARLEKRMTQAHLAGVAGVSEKTVRRAEGGDRLQPDSIRALSAALGLDASELRTEAEMRPDVAAEINSALISQAVRVRLLTRTFAVSSVATGVFFGFRDEPLAWEIGKWVYLALALAAFATPLVSVVLLALEQFSPRARSLQDWIKPRRWALSGVAASAFMPTMLIGAAAVITAALKQQDWHVALLALFMVFIVWMQANAAANEMLDLEGDPMAEGGGPLNRKFDAILTAGLTTVLLATVLPVLKWLFPRPAQKDPSEP